MSDPRSALPGAHYAGLVALAEAGPRGMITLRGDLSSGVVAAAVKAATGADMPAQRRIATGANGSVAWMSPDELLVMVDHPAAPASVVAMGAALKGEFATVADVSDARAVFTVTGAQARDVLGKLCPVDFADFEVGEIRRTRAAQVAAAVWRSDTETFTLICFRSVAQYMFDLLSTVAQPGGEVGFYR